MAYLRQFAIALLIIMAHCQGDVNTMRVKILEDKRTLSNLTAGDTVKMTCIGSRSVTDPQWRWEPSAAMERRDSPPGAIKVVTQNGSLTYFALQWSKIPTEASGTYFCFDGLNPAAIDTLDLRVTELQSPSIEGRAVQNFVQIRLKSKLVFECEEKGSIPTPNVTWFMVREAPFNHTEELEELPNDINKFYTINTTDSLSIFTLNRVDASAEYICQYENALGMARKRFSVKTRVRLHTGIVVAFAIMSLVVALFFTLRLAGRFQTHKNQAILVTNEKTKLLS